MMRKHHSHSLTIWYVLQWLKEAPVGVVPKSSPELPDLYPYVAKAFGKSLKRASLCSVLLVWIYKDFEVS